MIDGASAVASAGSPTIQVVDPVPPPRCAAVYRSVHFRAWRFPAQRRFEPCTQDDVELDIALDSALTLRPH